MVIEFLELLRPRGPWAITAIAPEITRTFTDGRACEAFIREQNRTRNLYYTLNTIKTAVSKKPSKADITQVEYLHVDADPDASESPREFKARFLPIVRAYHLKPTFIVDSGNGIQLLWRLAQPVPITTQEAIDAIEARNKGLMQAFGAPKGTHNIDRLLRLPGTTNIPTAAKLKKGRIQCDATLIEGSAGGGYPLDAFPLPTNELKDKPRSRKTGKMELPTSLANMLYIDGAGAYPSRSELLYAFINAALRAGVDAHAIIDACLDEQFAGKGIFEHVKHNKGKSYIKKQIEKALNERAPTAEGEKHLILWTGGKTHDAVKALEAAIIAHPNCQIYKRRQQLVEPLFDWEKSEDGEQDDLITYCRVLDFYTLAHLVGRYVAAFQRYDARAKKFVFIDPPPQVLETLLRLKHGGLRRLIGIITCPMMRRDGSLLTEQGYDAETQLWYKPAAGINLPPIPDRPTREQAAAALELLSDLLVEFPFASELGKSVALAAILTAVLRVSFPRAPLFLILAPTPGSGKTYLVDIVSTIAIGHRVIPINCNDDPKELEKRIETAAMDAPQILHLNNLPNYYELGSIALGTLATEAMVQIRRLGKHEGVICDCRHTTVFANGNNVTIKGDLVRRTLTCRIVPKEERPETRDFKHSPIDMIRADRGKYLAAVFTIARAYMAAGCPQVEGARLAGFDGWLRVVRNPLVWLGMPDPCITVEEARKMDPVLQDFRTMIEVLKKYIKAGDKFTAADCEKLAEEMTPGFDGRGVYRRPDLRNLMMVRGQISSKSFGKKLSSNRDRIVDGWSIELVSADAKTANTYRLVGPETELAQQRATAATNQNTPSEGAM
jgi:hypothetical protein